MNETINYYNVNAETFYNTTVHADMTKQYKLFLKYLKPESKILDFGCGSGRDSKYFLEQGYQVISLDGSEKLCEKASKLTGQEVLCMQFHEIDFENEFDGIWACASLLHLEEKDLPEIFDKLGRALKKDGVIYCSFKYGTDAGERKGRHFTDMTEAKMNELILGLDDFVIERMYITQDVRSGRGDEMWLNVIVRKINEVRV